MTRASRHTGPVLTTVVLLAGAPLALAVPQAAAEEEPTCQGQPATIVGTEYADPLHGTPGDDVVWLGGTALEPGGVDTFDGGDGDDLICQGGPGKAQVQGDGGNDEYVGTGYASGGAGNDTLVVKFTNIFGANFNGGDGDDELIGTNLSETFVGGDGADRIVAGGGRDWILEGPGSDVIDAGGGADTVYYGDDVNGYPHDRVPDPVEVDAANGTVRSGADLDTVAGNECWVGTGMGDVMLGSAGPDCLDGGVGGGRDEIRGRAGDDRITFYSGEAQGGSGDDTLRAEYPYEDIHDELNELTRTRTRIVGGPGDDNLRVDGHRVTARGGQGRDRLNLSRLGSVHATPYDPAPSWRIDVPKGLVNGRPQLYENRVDFAGLEVYVGSRHKDTFLGSADDEVFDAGDGADRAMGGPGRDLLKGGAGPDVLEGGGGRDTLRGGEGRPDLADGGRGRDRCSAERRVSCEARA